MYKKLQKLMEVAKNVSKRSKICWSKIWGR